MEISPIGKAKIHRLYSYYLYHITYFLVKKNIVKSENFGSKPRKKTHKFRIYKQLQILNWAKFSQNFDAHQGIRYPAMAACFAVAHIIVQGRIILVLTFLPGLVPGWLFIRTKLLLAPILFHSMGQAGWVLAYAVFCQSSLQINC